MLQRDLSATGKSWLAVDTRTGELGYVRDPRFRMGPAVLIGGKWYRADQFPNGTEISAIYIDEAVHLKTLPELPQRGESWVLGQRR
ncbi:MAG TPA: hypothetical protein V6C81_02275 [Planktothrix sp.]|jgi:hypothetical protein